MYIIVEYILNKEESTKLSKVMSPNKVLKYSKNILDFDNFDIDINKLKKDKHLTLTKTYRGKQKILFDLNLLKNGGNVLKKLLRDKIINDIIQNI